MFLALGSSTALECTTCDITWGLREGVALCDQRDCTGKPPVSCCEGEVCGHFKYTLKGRMNNERKNEQCYYI